MCGICTALRPVNDDCVYAALKAPVAEGADAADDSSTAYAIEIGDTFTGTLSEPGDRDWVEIRLTAGLSYDIDLTGQPSGTGTLSDPYLRLYDGGGGLIDLDDDGGDGTEARLSVTPDSTGVYYAAAGSYGDTYAGSYALSVDHARSEGTDAPENSTTPYALRVGESFSGEIDSASDRDWIAVDLTAGDRYAIRLQGTDAGAGPLGDPYLRLYDDTGALIAGTTEGTGSDPVLTVVASYSGTHYLSAAAFHAGTGSYDLSVAAAPTSPAPTTASLEVLADYLVNGYWADTGGSAHRFDTSADNRITVNISALTEAGQQLARWAFEAWEAVADLDFSETDGSAMITFDDDDDGAYTSYDATGALASSAEVNISTNWLASYGTALGTYSFQTYIHEIGHALGLGHQGPYDGSASYGSDETFANDSWQLSVMSYFDQDDNTTTAASYAELVSAMITDIIAIQGIYGAAGAGSLTDGKTVYGVGHSLGDSWLGRIFDSYSGSVPGSVFEGEPVAFTIYDAGGRDRIDLSHDTGDQAVDLREEGISDVNGLVGNMVIARGTRIENYTAGLGHDTVLGNAARNTLRGNDGNDRLNGAGGKDRLFGGNGDDVLSGGSKKDKLNGGAGNDTLDGGAGTDVLKGSSGADTFVFSGGRDKVKDFDALSAAEKIDLRGAAGITGFADLIDSHAGSSGGDVILTDDTGASMTLKSVSLADLDAGDFLFG